MLAVPDSADVLSSMASRVTADGDGKSDAILHSAIQALFGDALDDMQLLGTDSPDLWRPLEDWQID